MDEVLSMSEIEARYPSEWVLIADPEVDDRVGVVRGKVVFHSKVGCYMSLYEIVPGGPQHVWGRAPDFLKGLM